MDLPALGTDPVVDAFYDKRTGSLQYVVADPETKHCAIIDPVLDFEPKSGATATHSADALLRYVQSEGYVLDWVLDTHPHADHFSAAAYLKDTTGVRIAIGEKVLEVQKLRRWSGEQSNNMSASWSRWCRIIARLCAKCSLPSSSMESRITGTRVAL